MRDYFLHVKTVKHWQPKTIRPAVAGVRLFFVEQLGHQDWTVFSQIRAHDHDRLPAVLTREQVAQLLCHIQLRRYRIPIKLIYCCGRRLSVPAHPCPSSGEILSLRTPLDRSSPAEPFRPSVNQPFPRSAQAPPILPPKTQNASALPPLFIDRACSTSGSSRRLVPRLR